MAGVKHNFHQVAARLKNTPELGKARQAVLDAWMVRVQSWAYQDFRARSARKAAGGLSWQPISPVSVAGRIVRASDSTTKSKSRSGAGELVRRRLRRDSKGGNRSMRAAVLWRAITDPKWIPEFYAAWAREWANHKIGVDTGLLANSLKAGGQDGVAQKKAMSIVVGSNVRYAEFFDAKRPIFGQQFIDAKRRQELQAIGQRQYKRVVEGLI